jgi:hypothetical protein
MAAASCAMFKSGGSGAIACGREVIMGGATACTVNPADCEVDSNGSHWTWTLGNTSSSINTTDIQTHTNALVKCLRGDAAACVAVTAKVGSLITVDSASRVGAFGSSGADFPGYLASKDNKAPVQVLVYDQPNCSAGTSNNAQVRVVGIATLEIRQIQGTGNPKFVRGVIKCGVTVPGASPGGKDFGTLAGKTPAKLVQ